MYRSHSPWKEVSSGLPAVVLPRKAYAARPASPAITSGNVTFFTPKGAPTSTGDDHVLPLSRDVEIIPSPPACRPFASRLTESSYPKYHVPALSAATDGSLRSVAWLLGSTFTLHVAPLFVETTAAWLGKTQPG